MKFKQGLLSLWILSISILLSAVLGEGLIRLILPLYDPIGMVSFHLNEEGLPLGAKNSVTRQWKNTGDFNVMIRINSYGFRDGKDIQFSSADDFFVVGDSFSFGWGVEEEKRYSNLLEAALGTRVYNIATGSANMRTYENLIRYAIENGATIRNLIIGVCMENDILDYDHSSSPPSYRTKNRSEKVKSLKSWLMGHSALYNLTASLIHQNEMLKKVATRTGFVIENYDGMNQSIFNEAALSSSARKLLELTRPYNSFIVIIPSRGLWVGNNRKTERIVHEEFVRRLTALGLNVIDLRSPFEESGNPLQYHFKNDGHWNERGHLLAAQIIAKSIRD